MSGTGVGEVLEEEARFILNLRKEGKSIDDAVRLFKPVRERA